MKDIESGSVDLVLADPPYGMMKGINNHKMDSIGRYDEHKWDSKINTADLFAEAQRVLREGGAMILFAQNGYANELQNQKSSILEFSYRAVWVKDHFANALSAKKAMVSHFEDVLIFRKKYDDDFKNPLRAYSKQVMEFVGLNLKAINARLAHRRAEHFFYWDSSQFGLCTEKTYNELIEVFSIDQMPSFKTYTEMKAVYDDFYQVNLEGVRQKYAPTFNLPEGKKHKSNVLTYAKDRPSIHPTQKPVALLEDLIYTFSNKGDTVLDFAMGSGSTGVAAKNLNRNFIGIELDETYFKIAQERIL
ncbi:MAG: DNA methylase [Halobacteriovoraceae bacterium]|nr:DNA methylase [Halobacteriovoraceae bacterium]